VTTALAVLAVVVVVGSYLLVQSTQGQYYLADSDGQVVVYRGISDPGKVLWISLSHVYQQAGIPLAQVPVNDQQVVTAASVTGSLSQVDQAVATLRAAVDACRNQYATLETWVVQEDRYQAEVARLHAAHKPTTGLRQPGPQPSVGPTCQPSQAFGISASALSPAPAGSS
jgi:hypothetical protein